MPVTTEEITILRKQAKGNAYLLTMPLLCASYLKDDVLFSSIRNDFLVSFHLDDYQLLKEKADIDTLLSAMKKSKDGLYFNAWLWGRLLVSASTLNPESNLTKHITALMTQTLSSDVASIDKKQLPFYLWAKTYLLTSITDNTSYEKYKSNVMDSLTFHLTSNDVLENKLWSLVIAITAAGKHHDNDFYNALIKEFLSITNTKDLVSALLFVPPGSSGYRLWAFSLVQLAAAQVNDNDSVAAIEKQWHALSTDKNETEYAKTLSRLIHAERQELLDNENLPSRQSSSIKKNL